jgi:hypothetical protein
VSNPFYRDYQVMLRDRILADQLPGDAFDSLGDQPRRWQAYRRMVRTRFYDVAHHAFERLAATIGAERFRSLIDAFLAHAPPRSPYLRDVPGEVVAYAASDWARLQGALGLPDHALDLMRYEWAELDAGYSHEEVSTSEVVPLVMDRPAVLSPTHRLLQLRYAVHQIGTDSGEATQVAAIPTLLCLYRDPKTHEVETLELTPVAFAILAGIEKERVSLTDVVRNASGALHVGVDVAFVEALSALLADLVERGVVLGSTPSGVPQGLRID